MAIDLVSRVPGCLRLAVVGILIQARASAADSQRLTGIELDAGGRAGQVAIHGAAVIRVGQRLVISPSRSYLGETLPSSRPVRVVLDAAQGASLTVDPGGELVIEGETGRPVEIVTDPADPPQKGLFTVRDGGKATLREAAFINAALRIEGGGVTLSRVSVQYAGDQPAFTFAGATGSFDHLFAHHCTWGISAESRAGKSCDLTIRETTIRSCSKGTAGSTHGSGGALRTITAPGANKHRLRLIRVDWDPSWDELDAVELEVSKTRPRIVAMGDSIAQGCCKYVNFWNYIAGNDDIEHSWPYALQKRTDAYFVVNKAEGGFVTAQMLGLIPGIVEKVRPKYCYLGGGTNDLGAEVPPGKIVQNFQLMWEQLKRAGIVPIQLAITPNTRFPDREPRIQMANAMLQEACREAGVRFENVYSLLAQESGWGLDKNYDPGDGLHLNKAGYERIGNFLFIPPPQESDDGRLIRR